MFSGDVVHRICRWNARGIGEKENSRVAEVLGWNNEEGGATSLEVGGRDAEMRKPEWVRLWGGRGLDGQAQGSEGRFGLEIQVSP